MRVLLLLLLLAPLAAAQGHDHGAAGIAIVSDLAPGGLAHVGTPAQFALIAFGDDRVPDFHQDLPVRVLFQDRVLWETTAITGHDYDGVNTFSVAFPAPGPFSVQALMDGDVVATYNGTAVDAEPRPDVALTVQSAKYASSPGTTFRYNLTSQGLLLHHVDAWFELWWEGQLVLRTHTHTHDEDQSLWLRYPSPGQYTVRIIGFQAYPTPNAAAFTPVVYEERFEVATPVPSVGVPAGMPMADNVPTAANAVIQGEAGPEYELLGTYDPFTRVGPGTLQTLSAIVIDPATGLTVQHVDFEASLVGPQGEVFRSGSLHEYDGIYELATQQHTPGVYVMHVSATRGDWSGTLEVPYLVLPPAQATLAGPQTVRLAADPAPAGSPGDAVLSIRDLAGRPFAHGEIMTQIVDARGVPLVQAKLHTHALGDYPFTVALPDERTYDLRLSPFPLDAQPVTQYDLSQARSLSAGAGPGFERAAVLDEPVDDAQAPGPAWVLALAMLALLARRR